MGLFNWSKQEEPEEKVIPNPDEPIVEEPVDEEPDEVRALKDRLTVLQDQVSRMTQSTVNQPVDDPLKDLNLITEDVAESLQNEDGALNIQILNQVLTEAIRKATEVTEKSFMPKVGASINSSLSEQKQLTQFAQSNDDLSDVSDFVENTYGEYRRGYPDKPVEWALEQTDLYVRKMLNRPKQSVNPPNIPGSKGRAGGQSRSQTPGDDSPRKRVLQAYGRSV
jgi:hypothetical protein